MPQPTGVTGLVGGGSLYSSDKRGGEPPQYARISGRFVKVGDQEFGSNDLVGSELLIVSQYGVTGANVVSFAFGLAIVVCLCVVFTLLMSLEVTFFRFFEGDFLFLNAVASIKLGLAAACVYTRFAVSLFGFGRCLSVFVSAVVYLLIATSWKSLGFQQELQAAVCLPVNLVVALGFRIAIDFLDSYSLSLWVWIATVVAVLATALSVPLVFVGVFQRWDRIFFFYSLFFCFETFLFPLFFSVSFLFFSFRYYDRSRSVLSVQRVTINENNQGTDEQDKLAVAMGFPFSEVPYPLRASLKVSSIRLNGDSELALIGDSAFSYFLRIKGKRMGWSAETTHKLCEMLFSNSSFARYYGSVLSYPVGVKEKRLGTVVEAYVGASAMYYQASSDNALRSLFEGAMEQFVFCKLPLALKLSINQETGEALDQFESVGSVDGDGVEEEE